MLIAAIFCITIGIILRILGEYPMLDIFICFIGAVLFCFYLNSDTPTAMDVYKSKTTLEITYKDGVPVDSVVVFKNKEK